MQRKTYDRPIKLLLIGGSSVGKSSIMSRFSDDASSYNYVSTVGVDFKTKAVDIDGKKIKIQIWECGGQERFHSITPNYCRGAMGIILVYDITSTSSFNNIENWIRTINENSFEDAEQMIVGNKCDMEQYRKVPKEKGEILSTEKGIAFFETSAKTNVNIEEVFLSLTKHILNKISTTSTTEPPKMTVANKSDMEQYKKVPKEKNEIIFKRKGTTFFETSARTNANIKEACLNITKRILNKDATTSTAKLPPRSRTTRPEIQKIIIR